MKATVNGITAERDISFYYSSLGHEKICFIVNAATANMPSIRPVCPSLFIASLCLVPFLCDSASLP